MSSSVSVVLLLVGIISSRAGLYIADLTVHQIFQQVSCLATIFSTVKHLDFVIITHQQVDKRGPIFITTAMMTIYNLKEASAV